MRIEISQEPITSLEDYSRIPIAFEVERVLDLVVQDNGLGGFLLSERSLDLPWIKDYDAIESPVHWPERFDMSNWGLFAARIEGQRAGGAVVVFDTRELI